MSGGNYSLEKWHKVPGPILITWMALFSIWILVPLIGNSMLLFVSLKIPAIRKDRATLFLISAYIASLMVSVIATPGEMLLGTGLGENFLPQSMASMLCKLCVYSFTTAAFANVWSQAASAVDQWLAIVHGTILNRKQTTIVIMLIWMLAAAYACRNLITTGHYVIHGSDRIKGCTEGWLLSLSHDSVTIFVLLAMDKKLRDTVKEYFLGLCKKPATVTPTDNKTTDKQENFSDMMLQKLR